MFKSPTVFAIMAGAVALLPGPVAAFADGNIDELNRSIEQLILDQPAYSAEPVGGSAAGPVWSTKNVAYSGHGCEIGWTRDFTFSLGPAGDPLLAKSFDEKFGGAKEFRVDLTLIAEIEKTATAPNQLDGVNYELSEIIFRGERILSGEDLVEMSGIIIGGEDVRDELFKLVSELHGICQINNGDSGR